ncbi:Beta-glucosidase 4, partial [Frankliniella fusca]
LNSFRFSIAWTRIFPNGDINNKNDKGVQHYHNVIKAIKAHNMKPVVTIYHFDHPQALEDKFQGWMSDQMIQSFADFADFLFSEYGKEVSFVRRFGIVHIRRTRILEKGEFPPPIPTRRAVGL